VAAVVVAAEEVEAAAEEVEGVAVLAAAGARHHWVAAAQGLRPVRHRVPVLGREPAGHRPALVRVRERALVPAPVLARGQEPALALDRAPAP
jgi:hypothetical protein